MFLAVVEELGWISAQGSDFFSGAGIVLTADL
jgi:hypothetical protein